MRETFGIEKKHRKPSSQIIGKNQAGTRLTQKQSMQDKHGDKRHSQKQYMKGRE